jgi:hypothetical protein
MTNTLSILFIIIVFTFSTPSHTVATKKYIQKTVSSLDTLWLSPHVSTTHFYQNYNTLNKKFHNTLTLKRFQHTSLPPTIQHLFRKKLYQLSNPTPSQIEGLLSQYVIPKLKAIINSTENLKLRQQQLTEHDEKITFAQIKGKSTSLTQKQLNTILNTAYIFVPYLSKSHTKINVPGKNGTKKAITTLTGGVFWYHIKYDSTKAVSIHLNHQVHTETKYEINVLTHLVDKTHLKKIIDNAIYASEKKAFNALIGELALKTRQLPAFKLTDQIVEANKNQYAIRIGKRENIKLDDTFYMYEWVINNNKKQAKHVGFGYITHVGNNIKKPDHKSTFTQQLGDPQSIGGWIKEDPRYKLSLRLSPFYQTGLSIKKDAFNLNPDGIQYQLLDKDYDSAVGINATALYNLAQYTNISQLFGTITIRGSIPISSSQTSTNSSSSTVSTVSTYPLLYSGYVGLKKKFWKKNHSLAIRTAIGYDGIYLLSSNDHFNNIDIRTPGTEIEMGYENLLSPNTSLFITITKKWTLSNAAFNYSYRGTNYSHSQSINDFSLGGIIISAGVELHF